MRSTLYEATCLALVSMALAACYNHFSARGLTWIRSAPTISYAADTSLGEDFTLPAVSVTDSSQHPQTPLFITMEQARRWHSAQRALFVDAREAERFNAGHVAGALNVPLYQPETWPSILRNLAEQTTIVAYCDDDCDSARRLGEALMGLGYSRVYVMDRGYDSWRDTGLPTAQITP